MITQPMKRPPVLLGRLGREERLGLVFAAHVVYQESHEVVEDVRLVDIARHVEDGRVLYKTQREKRS